jgi:hypothetical protein
MLRALASREKGASVDESEYLRERARHCYRMARLTKMPNDIARFEAQAAEFDRQAAELEARVASLR